MPGSRDLWKDVDNCLEVLEEGEAMYFRDYLVKLVQSEIDSGDDCHQTAVALDSLKSQNPMSLDSMRGICSDMGWNYDTVVQQWSDSHPYRATCVLDSGERMYAIPNAAYGSDYYENDVSQFGVLLGRDYPDGYPLSAEEIDEVA